MSNERFEISLVEGNAIASAVDLLSELRMEIFREYPYLYESDPVEEKTFVQSYLKSSNTFFVLAKEQTRTVGMISAIPLIEATEEGWSSNRTREGVFYLGELLVRKEARGSGLAASMYDLFEKEVRAKKIYSEIAFKEVVRPLDDPRRPKGCFSLDSFWMKRGYVKHPELTQELAWPEIGGGKDVMHTLVFWIKELSDVLARRPLPDHS